MKTREIVDILAERSGRSLDFAFKLEIKAILDAYRARYMKNTLERNPQDRRFFQTTFVVPLTKTGCDKGECVLVSEPIPAPLRSNVIFDYVGSPLFDKAFNYTLSEAVAFHKHAKYTGKKEKWSYVNSRLYIYNNPLLEEVGVKGVFEKTDFSDYPYIKGCNIFGEFCEDNEDMEYPMPQDLIQPIITEILKSELSIQINVSDQKLTTNGEEPTGH